MSDIDFDVWKPVKARVYRQHGQCEWHWEVITDGGIICSGCTFTQRGAHKELKRQLKRLNDYRAGTAQQYDIELEGDQQ